MGSERTSFTCEQCAYQTGKWLGRCPECATWGSLVARTTRSAPRSERAAPPRPYPEIQSADVQRGSSGSEELDRVLGGGFLPGMVVLLAGEPGIGKSTLLLQIASNVADRGQRVLYVSGEESASQLRSRGERLGVRSHNLLIASETAVEAILEAARVVPPRLLLVDSVQAVHCSGLGSAAGSVAQVREAAARLTDFAKATDTPLVLVGHVTKEGGVAGPRALEHVVDTVIHFEGDRHHEHRILRALKNRFGPADEIAVFEMGPQGLRGVARPSELFLAERQEDTPGSAVLAAVEGTRSLLVEVQALVGETAQGSPRRTALGVDPGRVALILAVLELRAGLALATRDVFVNVTGGLNVSEPAADLAVAAAVASSLSGKPIGPRTVVAGEIGLTGEIRAVSRIEARLTEASRLGFDTAVTPAGGRSTVDEPCMRRIGVQRIDEALDRLLRPSGTQIG